MRCLLDGAVGAAASERTCGERNKNEGRFHVRQTDAPLADLQILPDSGFNGF
jgi:hypothetical protein